MTITIEHILLSELIAFLHEQGKDAFPDLNDELYLNLLAKKWYKNAEFCVCRDNKKKLKGMIAFYANKPAGGIAYIPHVYVSKQYRGKGLFSSMFFLVKQYVREKGYGLIRLEVKKNNNVAQKVYQKSGFVSDGYASEESIYMLIKI